MLYTARPRQSSAGEAIGIILLDATAPIIPGDVANATTYNFPVRFQLVPGLTSERIFKHDLTLVDSVIEAGMALKSYGVRAITGDCGFLALYQTEMARRLELPVFMSSLLQVPFMLRLIPDFHKVGIITANSQSLDEAVLTPCGANVPERIVIRGLEDCPNFAGTFIEENGILDTEKVEAEVVSMATALVRDVPEVKMLLLECSDLAPYGQAIQQVTGLPVFDFVTMINYVFSAVVKQGFSGYM